MTATGTGDSLTFTASAPASVPPGESVVVRLRLANASTRPLEVHLQGRETVFDVVVLDMSGREVWRRLAGASTLSILQLRPLAVGEAVDFTARWDQVDRAGARVPPGEYQVVGELPTDSAPIRSSPIRLRIGPERSAATGG